MDLATEISRLRLAAAGAAPDEVEHLLSDIDRQGRAAGALARALVAIDREDFAEALDRLSPAIEVPEVLASGWALARGEALLGLERYEQALDAFDERLGDDPTDVDAEVGRARALFRLGRLDEAEPALRASAALHPDHFEATYGLAVLLLAKDALDEAVELLDRAQKLNPLHTGPYRALAQLALHIGQPDVAITPLEHVLENPVLATPPLLLTMAEVYAAAGRFEALASVLRVLEQTVALEPGHAVELARLWFEASNAEEIRGLADLFTLNHPGRDVVLALADEVVDESDAAIVRYHEALRRAPDVWVANERLAYLLLQRGAPPDEVEPLVRRVEAQLPDSMEARLLRAVMEHLRGDPAAAQVIASVAAHGGTRPSYRWLAATLLSGGEE